MADLEEMTPERCREYSVRCRDLARAETNPDIRKNLEDVAASWEQLCEELDKIEKRKETVGANRDGP